MSDKGTILGHIAPIAHDADGIDYNNTTSGLISDNVQEAIDELTINLDFNRIVTHQRNAAGNLMMVMDAVTGAHLILGPIMVTDKNGNAIVTK
jgi:hypothetical protein